MSSDLFFNSSYPSVPSEENILYFKEGSQDKIKRVCDQVKELLLEKNRKYGDAALSPLRIFSKSDPSEQLRVRIDDKLSRIANGALGEDEDPLLDLIGYLILLKVSMEDK